MKTFKSQELLFSRFSNFLIAQSIAILLVYFLAISLAIGSIYSYQKNAYNYIEVIAHTQNNNPVFSLFNNESVDFDLIINSKNSELAYKNMQTPYKIKIPKTEQIQIQVKTSSKAYCLQVNKW